MPRPAAALAAAALAAFLLAGCSEAPAADAPAPAADAAPPANTGLGAAPNATANATVAQPPRLVVSDCRGAYLVAPVPMEEATSRMPDGFRPIHYTGLLGAEAGEPAAALLLFPLRCAAAHGMDGEAVGVGLAYVGIAVEASEEYATGNDIAVLAVGTDSELAAAFTRQTGIEPVQATVTLTDGGSPWTVTADVSGPGVSFDLRSASPDAESGTFFGGRFISVVDRTVTGVMDYGVHDGAVLSLGAAVSQVRDAPPASGAASSLAVNVRLPETTLVAYTPDNLPERSGEGGAA